MKKLFILAVMALTTVAATAQTGVGEFSIKPKLGLNFASLTDLSNTKTKTDFVVGAEGEYQATSLVGVSAGLLFSMQGVGADVSSGSNDYNLNYLNIPVLANFYLAEGLALKVGLQPGFMLSAKHKVEYNNSKTETDIKDNCETFDLSIPLGISYEWMNFIVDGRYNWGVKKVWKGSNSLDSKNSVIQFTVGYRFALK